MLRTEVSMRTLTVLWALCAGVGMLSAWLVLLGNPGNMGICGACFLRDTAGAFGLFAGPGPRIFRPELVGLVLGAGLLLVARRTFTARAGSFAGARFFLGAWMGIGALVFLGCPFRMLQRIGGGDLNAVIGLVGFLVGVRTGVRFESRGYSAGKTVVAPTPTGMPAILISLGALAIFLLGAAPSGPGPNDVGPPPHAFWASSLAITLLAGAILSLTGFCAVSAGRQVFKGPRKMVWACVCLVLGYGVIAAVNNQFALGFANQPIAHSEHLWNILAMTLVGLAGVLAGGCPVRLIVLAGEGNGDAMVTAAGILAGGALSHSMGLASSLAGTTAPGRVAVGVGLVLCLAYGWAMSIGARNAAVSQQ